MHAMNSDKTIGLYIFLGRQLAHAVQCQFVQLWSDQKN